MSGCIVFDLDGTLIDSAPDIQGIANAVLGEVGAAPITLDETRSFIGDGFQVFVARMRAARAIPDSEQARMLEEVVARYDDAVTLTVTYPDVVETLEALSARHRLGICTNKLLRPCMAVLRHLEIEGFFGSVWGGDNPLARKPDPAPLLAVFEELGEGRRLYVGDSEVDAETAQRAGVPFLLFTEGYRKSPVASIPHEESFSEFKDLMGLVDAQL
ncbi:MAG: HAD-IA family hydrolase [Silicimonas sp.]|jgi:phosphoglycolate phosphatase|nr:HAD-IA family hydrolase [Silicimonas sp.]